MVRTRKPITAGILNIISGVFFLIGGITIFGLLGQPMAAMLASYVRYSMGLTGAPSASFITTTILVTATALMIPGLISILGGVYSIKRSIWGLALAGSISTFLSLLFLGMPAIVLTALSKKEFA